ncbi:Defensin-like protein 1 [Bienertia sinuspersici]
MKSMKPFGGVGALILILLLAVTLEIGPRTAEGLFGKGRCNVASKFFHGPCGGDTNCDTVCKAEGFRHGGNCHGLRRRCFCCPR